MKLMPLKNYLSMIKNSIGTEMFRELWVDEDDKEKDILNGGELSCAVFVTSLLKLHGMIDERHATVKTAVESMINFGWREIDWKDIKEGDVLIWERKKTGYKHPHIGFYAGDKKAISNSWKLKKVVRHGWDYGGRRKITKVLRWEWK